MEGRPAIEEWKEYPDGPYEVSSLGQVRRVWPLGVPTLLKHDDDGVSEKVTLFLYNGKRIHTAVARVVAATFTGPPPSSTHIVHHKDENYHHNWPSNLEYTTRLGHYRNHTPLGLGDNHGTAKLKEHEVREIRRLYAEGVRQDYIASIFHVHPGTVNSIVHRRRWAWVED